VRRRPDRLTQEGPPPLDPGDESRPFDLDGDHDDPDAGDAAVDAAVTPEGHRHVTHDHGRWATFVGVVLILFGTLALIDRYLPALDVKHVLVPAAAIAIGALLIVNAVRREPMES